MSQSAKPPEDQPQQSTDGVIPPFLLDELDDIYALLKTFVAENDEQLQGPNNHSVLVVANLFTIFGNVLRSCAVGDDPFTVHELSRRLSDIESVSESFRTITSPEMKVKLRKHLEGLPFPHYAANPNDPDTVIQVTEAGVRRVGKFVDGKFKSLE